MSKFVIAPHFRLHEWVAEEKGYFTAEGLEYEFREQTTSKDGKVHDLGNKVGIEFSQGLNNLIGGTTLAARNIIAGNDHIHRELVAALSTLVRSVSSV